MGLSAGHLLIVGTSAIVVIFCRQKTMNETATYCVMLVISSNPTDGT